MTDAELRELDSEVHRKVMCKQAIYVAAEPHVSGPDPDSPIGFSTNFGGAIYTADHEWLVNDWYDPEENNAVPRYSSDITAAWAVVTRLQELNPGWRFDLLGGDRPFPTLMDRATGQTFTGTTRHPFGWSAEFFGHEDPEQCTGQRHGTGRGDTPMLAICRAALAATLTPPGTASATG